MMLLRAVSVMCACVFPIASFANSFCADLRDLLTFDPSSLEQATIALPNSNGTSELCRSSLGIGGTRALHCGWPFAYRASEAHEAFAEIKVEVAQCVGASEQPITDDLVNHPDSYDLVTYVADGLTISVSLKDKGALQKTYVFLRIETPKAR